MILNRTNTLGLRTDVVMLPCFEDVGFAKRLHDGATMMRRHFARLLTKGTPYNRNLLHALSEDVAYNLARIRNLDARLKILETCYRNYRFSYDEILKSVCGIEVSEDLMLNAIKSVCAVFIYLDDCENGRGRV